MIDWLQNQIDAFMATHELGPLLVLALVLLGGLAGGGLVKRFHLPSITGNILAGVLLGVTLLDGAQAAQALQPLSTFAIGLIAVSAGGHFSYRRVHNALRRILSITFFEVLCSFTAVFTVAYLMDMPWTVSLLLAALSAETAPATTMAIVRENRAKGPFVKTMLTVVSLDTSLCIILFAFARTVVADYYAVEGDNGFAIAAALWHTATQLLGSIAIGVSLGWVIDKLVNKPMFHHFSAVFLAVLTAEGLSNFLHLSPLLTCLFFGGYLGNSTLEGERQLRALEPLELLLYTLFFTLAGVGLHLEKLPEAGLLMVGYLLARVGGKAIGATVGGLVSGTTPRIWKNMPLSFFPQAGVAIGLVVLLEGDDRIPYEYSSLIGTLILAAVTVNEIVGPVFTKLALSRSKETGLDRPRLMEFLQEEFILTGLQATDKWEALRELTDFFTMTHRVPKEDADRLYETIVEREKSMTTAVGHGAAIPHGRVRSGPGVQGVLGICPEGVDFDAPDGEPVKLIVLIVTPKEHEKQHLQVLASLSTMISDDATRSRLMNAATPNDAWEVIEAEEAPNFNYFLEGEEDQEGGEGQPGRFRV
jgi:mannitol/fructose-specific phosphotransferase system IIA component (Ntr-type)